MNIFMLGHKSQAGKDTLANILIEKNNFVRFAFADKLKFVVKDLYNFTDEQMFGEEKNIPDKRYSNTVDSGVSYFTPRRILQIFGQDQRRLYADIWASYVFNAIEEHHKTTEQKNYIITDFRFPNEYLVGKFWQQQDPSIRNIYPIKIVRKDISTEFSGSDDISETALDSFPYWNDTIYNYGNLTETSKNDLYNQFMKYYNNTMQNLNVFHNI